VLAPYEGKLVRVEMRSGGYTVDETTATEAEEWWNASRPILAELPRVDEDYARLSTLEEIAVMDGAGEDVKARFGGKASNLARLQAVLSEDESMSEYREVGFAVPVHHYLEFLRSNRIASTLDPGREVSYEEYLEELFSQPRFQSDSSYRLGVLADFRAHVVAHGEVSESLVLSVALRILEVFGTTTLRVRCRSSSPLEDGLEFNGAGLYDSVSACAADALDADDVGPSHCDSSRSRELGIAAGLKRVWASLWNFRAYEERWYYQIPPDVAAMGVLVSRAFVGEDANGVAFTGNPANRDDERYVVVAQFGEQSVVHPEPGVLAERDVLEMGEDGRVARVIRSTRSSLLPAGVPEGTPVLSDEELGELGALLFWIDQRFPVDVGAHERSEVLLDFEFKKEAGGDLALKQVRPFLHSAAGASEESPTFELEIPAGTVACGVFVLSREPLEEYRLKSRIHFVEGRILLPTTAESFPGELFGEVLVGPGLEVAVPKSAGTFGVLRFDREGEETSYNFEYEQEFSLSAGRVLGLKLIVDYGGGCGVTVERRIELNEDYLVDGLALGGSVVEGEEIADLVYSSCTYETLPLFEIRAEFEGGSLVLRERFREDTRATGPASLTRGELLLGAERRGVEDYTKLVYAAHRHNEFARYWVVLEPPLVVESVDGAVHAVELGAPAPQVGQEAHISYLGENFEVLASVGEGGVSFDKVPIKAPTEGRFLRGEVVQDGGVNLSDAVYLLEHLFQSGEAPRCLKAADTNDDGGLNLTDAVRILTYLFGGAGPLPDPFAGCDTDPSPDDLGCESFAACG